MLQLAGEEHFDRPPDELWRLLVVPQFLCSCFPGVDAVLDLDDRRATVRVRPGFSFLRGTLEVSFEFVDTEPPERAQAAIHIRGIGSSAELQAELVLSATEVGSIVRWHAEARELAGLLKAISPGLLQAAAQKVASDTWSRIRQQLPVQ